MIGTAYRKSENELVSARKNTFGRAPGGLLEESGKIVLMLRALQIKSQRLPLSSSMVLYWQCRSEKERGAKPVTRWRIAMRWISILRCRWKKQVMKLIISWGVRWRAGWRSLSDIQSQLPSKVIFRAAFGKSRFSSFCSAVDGYKVTLILKEKRMMKYRGDVWNKLIALGLLALLWIQRLRRW